MAELAAEDLAEKLDDLFVDGAVVGEDVLRCRKRMKRAVHVAHAPAGFADQQDSGGHVPGIETEFPERVEPAAGDIGQVDRRRPGAADAVRRHGHLVIEVDVHVVMTLAAGEAGGGEAIGEARRLRHVNAAVVQPCSRSALGREHFSMERVIDHARDQLARALQAERDVEHGKCVREVGGAVQRIDVPAEFGSSVVAAAFFGDDAVGREVRAQPLDHELFAGAVGFGDEIEIAFQLEGDAALEEVRQQRAAFAGDFNGCFEVGQGGITTAILPSGT